MVSSVLIGDGYWSLSSVFMAVLLAFAIFLPLGEFMGVNPLEEEVLAVVSESVS